MSFVKTMDKEDEVDDSMETGHSLPESAEDVRLSAGVSSSGFMSTRKRNYLIVAFGVVVLALVLSVAIGFAKSSTNPSENTDRMQQTVSFLSVLSDPAALQKSGGPQHAAALWMANEDPQQYTIPSDLVSADAVWFTQRYALTVLYFALGGNGWVFNAEFLSDRQECGWFQEFTTPDGQFQLGVTCSDDAVVKELRLRKLYGVHVFVAGIFFACNQTKLTRIYPHVYVAGNNLQGTMPPEIGLLSELTHLTLFNNDIKGKLPSEMGLLTNMNFMSLGSNELAGTIPAWFGDLTGLTALELGDNKLTGNIPPRMTKMASLQQLALDMNNLVGEVDVLNDMPNLERLYLAENFFVGTLNEYFLDKLDLIELDLSDNNFVGSVPKHFFVDSSLEMLDISSNDLTGPFPALEVGKYDKMKYLSLHDNRLSGQIPPTIRNLTQLLHLDLSLNQFTGDMPHAITWMETLTYLFLSDNPFSAGTIPPFYDMVDLRELSIKKTNRNGTIPKWMGDLSNLVLLDFDQNQLSGTIPTAMGTLDKMAFMLLNGNNFTGTVPDNFSQLSQIGTSVHAILWIGFCAKERHHHV